MKTKFSRILTLFLAFAVQLTFAQQKTVSGVVTDANGLPLPGATVIVVGTSNGVATDFDGQYTIAVETGKVLQFSYVGYTTQNVTVGASDTINISLTADNTLEEVVVTALGIKREEKTLTYASQELKSEELNITEDINIKSAIAGKVAGVQIDGQAGSKLGSAGKIRIRGGISLTQDNDPLYIIDGVPTSDPNTIDMNNVETLNVLKGPNATALYGQRADAGVVVITTKKGKQGTGIGVEITSSISFDNVSYLPKYQNLYGQGNAGNADFGTFNYAEGNILTGAPYPDFMQVFDGQRYLADNVYQDVSWGPRFDGKPYIPWYAYYPDSPYFGQTDTWEAHPDNVKDFYNTGTTLKNGIALSGSGDNYTARLSYTNIDQSGIIPNSNLKRNLISASFDYDLSEKFSAGVNVNYSTEEILGDFADDYGNQTSGSFNSWFGRNVDVNKLRELKDLTSPDGYLTSWNNWGLDYYAYGEASGREGFKKTAFWFNPYSWLDSYKETYETTRLLADIHSTYKFNDNLSATVSVSRNEVKYRNDFYVPFIIELSAAPELYNAWVNSFGKSYSSSLEDNYNGYLRYENDFGDIDLSALLGGTIRKNEYYSFSNRMDRTNWQNGGLIIPDVYVYANSRESLTARTNESKKQVNSLFGNLSLGYKAFLYLDASVRRDWSSALPKDNNGYTYPSVGGTFIFSQLLDSEILSFGKIRASWAQVGNDVGAQLLNPSYPLGSNLYEGSEKNYILEYTNGNLVQSGIKPPLNTSTEFGIDLKFLNNRIFFSGTYYSENRKNEIIPVSISGTTGYNNIVANAGESERKGVELTLGADIFKSNDGFNWTIAANWAKNSSKILSLPGDLKSISGAGGSDDWGFVSVVHPLGGEWGQLRGTGFKRDDNGNRIVNDEGLYVTETDKYFGSILPDFTGGVLNTFSYKGLSLTASIDFQKGGKFFSLTEMWGGYSGLTAETAILNNNGKNVRDPLEDGGGINVVGVDTDGNPVNTYIGAQPYWQQFQPNRLAEPFIHNASYIKLRDISLSYNLPKTLLKGTFIQSMSVGLVGRNLWLISVSDDNVHRWDPSELSQSYGENAQLPGTRSYGMNIKLTF